MVRRRCDRGTDHRWKRIGAETRTTGAPGCRNCRRCSRQRPWPPAPARSFYPGRATRGRPLDWRHGGLGDPYSGAISLAQHGNSECIASSNRIADSFASVHARGYRAIYGAPEFQYVAHVDLRRGGPPARGDWHLWRDGVSGSRTHARNWHTHGAGRTATRSTKDGAWEQHEAGPHPHWDRTPQWFW